MNDGSVCHVCSERAQTLSDMCLDQVSRGLLFRTLWIVGDVGGGRTLSLQNMTEYEVSVPMLSFPDQEVDLGPLESH